jgi:hypothetical protein
LLAYVEDEKSEGQDLFFDHDFSGVDAGFGHPAVDTYGQ